ncbi:MAG: hypothetical protein R3C05_23960 [Pirellulaceae bacterium]
MILRNTNQTVVHPASYRDPAGCIYRSPSGQLLRQVNHAGASDYDMLMSSGLYERLVSTGQLVSHTETEDEPCDVEKAYKIIQPELLDFISYPYEWAFSALKAAAVLTLDIQETALKHSMTLKDASAYNVQFRGHQPVFIDTLSFEAYQPGKAWDAYGQFCRHFLAPLALIHSRGVEMGKVQSLYIDGVPLDYACKLLPKRTWLRPGTLMHLHLNSMLTRSYSDTSKPTQEKPNAKVTQQGLQNILQSLRKTVLSMRLPTRATTWADYYENNTYDENGQKEKLQAVSDFIESVNPRTVWDLGANTGLYSRIAANKGAHVVAFDIDHLCVERNYNECVSEQRTNLLPLHLDLTNPSPGIGWAHTERNSVTDRGPADAIMALALIHHIAISNNVPLELVAQYMHSIGRTLIIEWVPKHDPQVQRLRVGEKTSSMATRKTHLRRHLVVIFKSKKAVRRERETGNFIVCRDAPIPL